MAKFDGSKPGPGRPKGARNKVTAVAKEVIAEAAERLGGVDRLTAWAQEEAQNERAFWTTVYPKLLPLQVAGDPDGSPIQTASTIIYELQYIKPKAEDDDSNTD